MFLSLLTSLFRSNDQKSLYTEYFQAAKIGSENAKNTYRRISALYGLKVSKERFNQERRLLLEMDGPVYKIPALTEKKFLDQIQGEFFSDVNEHGEEEKVNESKGKYSQKFVKEKNSLRDSETISSNSDGESLRNIFGKLASCSAASSQLETAESAARDWLKSNPGMWKIIELHDQFSGITKLSRNILNDADRSIANASGKAFSEDLLFEKQVDQINGQMKRALRREFLVDALVITGITAAILFAKKKS